jgi:hypothetical protein
MFFEFIEFIGPVVLVRHILFERSLSRPEKPFELNKLKVGYRRFELGWILLKLPSLSKCLPHQSQCGLKT